MKKQESRRSLLAKREQVMSGLGVKFDTLARLGRVAEDDQAQLSHDEFVSLHLNSLDYRQLRLIEEALTKDQDSVDLGEENADSFFELVTIRQRLGDVAAARAAAAEAHSALRKLCARYPQNHSFTVLLNRANDLLQSLK